MLDNKKIPLLISVDTIVFPLFSNSIQIGKSESIEAVKLAIQNNNGTLLIGYPSSNNEINLDNILSVATLVIMEGSEEQDGQFKIKVRGLEKVKLSNLEKDTSFVADYEVIKEIKLKTKLSLELKAHVLKIIKRKLQELPINISLEDIEPFEKSSTSEFVNAIGHMIPSSFQFKINLLLENNMEKKLQMISMLIERQQAQLENSSVSKTINERVKSKMTKQQKEYYLREQLKAIQDELAEISGEGNEIEEMIKHVNNNPYPKSIKEKLLKEINKLANTPSQAAEANITRSYIETLMELPYWQKADDNLDINKAKEILDKDHFGLLKPKAKIVEFLAVKQNNPDSKGSILSLVGPPGTGKTTLAKSIANALGKPFIKISLGGIKDEAEIRGHRRTYIASMPGKIILAMKKAKVINPVILLDEIDKMSSDFKGDPTSAMLEVLDYEQNQNFNDHYLEEDYDLSNVTFIATANYMNQIPEALYDRLDIVELSSYTELEKLQIAKRHLIPAILKDTLIPKPLFKWSDEAITFVIQKYTIEAGVRQLRRVIDEMARKILVLKLNGEVKNSFTITPVKITKLLGNPKFEHTKKDDSPQIGTVTGLAWTQYGGDILPIEVSTYPGDGKIVITGQLKDVMTESAKIALSYVKANADYFGIPKQKDGEDIFKSLDIHVHSPDGATPKDGPSAGVTFTTALISALTKRPVSNLIGMTGEITLRGKVFPIGGLKEKSISANRSGLKTILIPEENLRDLVDIPQEVKDHLEIKSFKNYKEIYKEVFK